MHDQIGSTIALLNASGAQAATFAYSAYGAVTSSGTVTTPLQYTGQYTDAESRLVFLRARYYDPATAEFLTVDPDTDLTGTPYAYTGGNPLNAVDLSGRDWWNPFSWSSDTWSNIGTGALFGAAIVGTAACIILEPCGVGEGLALAGGGTLAASGISLGTVTAWGGAVGGFGGLVYSMANGDSSSGGSDSGGGSGNSSSGSVDANTQSSLDYAHQQAQMDHVFVPKHNLGALIASCVAR